MRTWIPCLALCVAAAVGGEPTPHPDYPLSRLYDDRVLDATDAGLVRQQLVTLANLPGGAALLADYALAAVVGAAVPTDDATLALDAGAYGRLLSRDRAQAGLLRRANRALAIAALRQDRRDLPAYPLAETTGDELAAVIADLTAEFPNPAQRARAAAALAELWRKRQRAYEGITR